MVSLRSLGPALAILATIGALFTPTARAEIKVGYSLKADEYQVFLPGTRFFGQKETLQAFGPASDLLSLLGVAPTIVGFLTENELIEGKPDPAKGIDASFVLDLAKK